MALICISVTNYVQHLFMCILAICLSLEKCQFKFFPHFKIILLLSFNNFFKDLFIPERESTFVLMYMGAERGSEGKGGRESQNPH